MNDAVQHHLKSLMPDGFDFVRELGVSPLSEVILVKDADGEFFALKVLRASVAKDPRIVERWQREAQILVELHHSNLVKCFGACQVDGRPALILEYVSGGTLREQLEDAPISWEKACRYGIQIARALEYLHRNGAIHRDVKPHNILLHPVHGAVLADLGLVLRDEDTTLTRHGAALGSPAYMSPEQSRNPSDVRAQTDIYSLGATLYHAISGRPPFVGNGVGEVIHRLLHEEPPAFEHEIPASLEKVIAVAMSKDEEQRYDSARSMGSDLGRAVLGYKPNLRTLHRGRQRRKRLLQGVALLLASCTLSYFVLPLLSTDNADEQLTTALDSSDSADSLKSAQQSSAASADSSNPDIITVAQQGFDEWVAADEQRFSRYLQNYNLNAADDLLQIISLSTPDIVDQRFIAKRKQWLTASKVQIRAAAERLAAAALNLLSQAGDDVHVAIDAGQFDADEFAADVFGLWRAANLDVSQLSVAAGHPDVLSRLSLAKERFSYESRNSSKRLNAKLLEDIVLRTRPLIFSADFFDLQRQFELLPVSFAAKNARAQMFMNQASVLQELQQQFRKHLERLRGQSVEFVLSNRSRLIGELLTDTSGEYYVDYHGQTKVSLNILTLKAEAVLEMLNFDSEFELAQLLWCQRQHSEALQVMENLMQHDASLATPWVTHWQLYLADTATKATAQQNIDGAGTQLSSEQLLMQLRQQYPQAKLLLDGSSIVIEFKGQTLLGEWQLDFSAISDRLAIDYWQLSFLCQTAGSVPAVLILQDEIIFSKADDVLSSSVTVGDNYLIGQGLETSAAVQNITWRNGVVWLNSLPLSPWQSEQHTMVINSKDSLVAITKLRITLRVN